MSRHVLDHVCNCMHTVLSACLTWCGLQVAPHVAELATILKGSLRILFVFVFYYLQYFSSNRLCLLDRGWVFAIAHIRGGGEMGRYW